MRMFWLLVHVRRCAQRLYILTTSEDSGGRESLAPLCWGSWAEKFGNPWFRLHWSHCSVHFSVTKFGRLRLAGLVGPIDGDLFSGVRKHVHKFWVGRRRPLGGRASAKAGPKSSESDAAVNNTSSSPKETALRASGLGHKYSCANSTREFARTCSGERGRERARPVCSLSIASSSTSEPQVADSRKASEASGGRWGKTDDSLSITSSLERRVLRRRFSHN